MRATRADRLLGRFYDAMDRYGTSAAVSDLDDAVAHGRSALAEARVGDGDLVEVALGLSAALHMRFRAAPLIEDLDEGIELAYVGAEAVDPGTPGLPGTLFTIANMLQERYQLAGDPADLDASVDVGRQALLLAGPDDPDREWVLFGLGLSLHMRRRVAPDPDDLDEAIAVLAELLGLTPDDHPQAQPRLVLLGDCLETRYHRTRDLQDLAAAIDVLRMAQAAAPAAWTLVRLTVLMRLRSERCRDLPGMDEAIDVGVEALAALDDEDVERGSVMAHLSAVYLFRYESVGDRDDLGRAVALGRDAAAAISPDDPLRDLHLAGLAHALRTRFDRFHVWDDIDEAVNLAREVSATTAYAPARGMALANLAAALQTRFLARGAADDLNEAIAAGRAGVDLVSTDDLNRGILLSGLGDALGRRFVRSHQSTPGTGLADLAEGVAACRAAVDSLAAADPRRGAFLSGLARVLMLWATRLEDTDYPVEPAELDEAVDVARAALAEVPAGHPMRGPLLMALAESLRSRFAALGDRRDLDEAADLARQGVSLMPADEPARADALIGLGDVLRALWLVTDDPGYAASAIEVTRQAAGSATARVRIRIGAALDWGRVAASLGRWDSAADAYALAVELRPMMAWRGLDRDDRTHLLNIAPELGADAAACAIAAGRPDRAVELLELSRGVLWSQMLDTRTGLTALHEAAPDLAAALEQVRADLDHPAGPNMRTAGRAWDDLLERIRALPGFASFLSPPRIGDLRCAALDGPVVLVNVSGWRCDALIVTSTATSVVELPLLTFDSAWARTRDYLDAAQDWAQTPNSAFTTMSHDLVLTELLDWMWTSIAGPVLTALGHTAAPADGARWPRVWWCPCGPLALLPLHAAGSVPDRVVSSYTPTLRVLASAQPARPAPGSARLLVIAMPQTPGQPDLPSVATERDTLVSMFAEHTVLNGPAATRAAATAQLARHHWVHFSCHGHQDLDDPSTAGVLVADGPLDVGDLTDGGRGGGDWVFLSACQSATGGIRNTDEMITLASALAYCGWRHVIATLWVVVDSVAAQIAAAVYRRAAPDGRLQPEQAAVALHDAVREVRAVHPDRPSTWASYIHTGP